MKRTVRAVVILLALAAGGFGQSPDAWAGRLYRGGAVATAHPMASEAALQMLNKGGNATDAAVAAAFTLAVVGPYHSGIGGGGFALVFEDATGETKVLDFREVAPGAATRDMYVKDGRVVPGLSTDGGLAVAVPGAALGYLELHAKHGKLPRATVLGPAIQAAKKGFWVSPKYQQMATARLECLRAYPESARIFLSRNAQTGSYDVPALGTLIKQPDLAKTLQLLASKGPSAFYKGAVAKKIAASVKESGGVLTEADLERYQVRWRKPLETTYRGHRVHTMPPPSAGGVAIVQVLGALETLEPNGPGRYRDPQHLHLFAEAVRRVYVDRTKYLGDPAFADVPLQRLTSREYIAELARSIDPNRATKSETLLPAAAPATGGRGVGGTSSGLGQTGADGGALVPNPEGTPHGSPTGRGTMRPQAQPRPIQPAHPDGGKNTTHISVVDKAGNAVAMTTTVNTGFGSCVVAKGTGVLLNNEMDDFSAQPMVPNSYGLVGGEANSIAPGKVPLSSMSPTIVFQKNDPKKVMLVVGSPGGSTIPTTVMQVIENVVDHGMDVGRAVGAGRIHHQYLPDKLLVDRYGLEGETRRVLEAKGHSLQDLPAWGDAEAVLVDPVTGLRSSASDPRNEGVGLGQD